MRMSLAIRMRPHPSEAKYEQLEYLHTHVEDISPNNLDEWISWANGKGGTPGGFTSLDEAIDAIRRSPWKY
jgi:hypothetical protein